MRGATLLADELRQIIWDFNPRTPCGVRRKRKNSRRLAPISIHAPHAGCDQKQDIGPQQRSRFQSTHPMRGATEEHHKAGALHMISIHAPHAGCDKTVRRKTSTGFVFQSTHPMRGATKRYKILCSLSTFQSTHPMRGATFPGLFIRNDVRISIHAPHAGCDSRTSSRTLFRQDFNPRTPCGVRPIPCDLHACLGKFQSTHPMRGATS